jgi:hypothetical protein
MKVTQIVEMSEATISVTILVSSLVSTPSEIAKHNLAYSATELDLLIAPCPSAAMHIVMKHRISMASLRAQLKDLIASASVPSSLLDANKNLARPKSFLMNNALMSTGGSASNSMGMNTNSLENTPTNAGTGNGHYSIPKSHT